MAMIGTTTHRRLVGLAAVVVVIAVWEVGVRNFDVPTTSLPAPSALWARAVRMAADERLDNHTLVTVSEILRGVGIGLGLGIAFALLFARARWVERLVMPAIVVMQVTPKIAIAPLLVLWMGLGAPAKVVLVALVTFFPVLVNTLMGLRSINTNTRQLCQILGLTGWQRFNKVELPSVIPNVVAGLRLGGLAGVTAAVIGEIIGAKAGLGYLVMQSQESGDVAQGLNAVVVLSLIGLTLWLGAGALASKADAMFRA